MGLFLWCLHFSLHYLRLISISHFKTASIAAGRHLIKQHDDIHNSARQYHLTNISASTSNMAIPDYGAAPLAKTFMLMRALSLLAMVCVVGLTANFVSEIVSTNVDPPREIVGTLVIVSHGEMPTDLKLC